MKRVAFCLGFTVVCVSCGVKSSFIEDDFLVPFFNMVLSYAPGTESQYTLSDTLSFGPEGVRITPNDQTDNDNSSAGFGGMTLDGLQWDSSNSLLRLNSTVNRSDLDSSWTPAWDQLISYWRLNESSGATNVVDSRGTNPTGNTANVTFGISGQVQTAASFNGVNSNINLGNTALYNFGTSLSFTVSFWVNWTTSVPSNLRIVGNGASGYSNGWTVTGNSSAEGGAPNGIFFYMGAGGVAANSVGMVSTAPLNDGNWHHVVISVDQTNKTISFYTNGLPANVLSATPTCAASASGNVLNFSSCTSYNTNHANVSAIGSSSGGTAFWNGSIDDVAIWSAHLSEAQVKTIYQRQSARYSGMGTSRVMDSLSSGSAWNSLAFESTLPFFKELPSGGLSETTSSYSSQSADLMVGNVGHWSLNETSGTTVTNGSNSSLPGTLVGSATRGVNGRLGSSYLFDGTTGSINLPSSGIPTGNSSRTIALWVFPLASNKQSLFFQGAAGAGTQVDICYNGNVSMQYGSGSLDFGTIPTHKWSHIALTYDGGTARGYVNGVATAVGSLTLGTNSSTPTLGTGECSRDTGGGGTSLRGAMDEVAIWSRALNAAEILGLYRRGGGRAKFQIRSCSDSTCSTNPSWLGPDGTNQSYFSELYNTTNNILGGSVRAESPLISFLSLASLNVPTNRYFQYRVFLESDMTASLCAYGACSPEIKSVTVGPDHFPPGTVGSVTSSASIGEPYRFLKSFQETLGSGGCASGTRHALSPNGTDFYYWNSSFSEWSLSSQTYATSSLTSEISANIRTFPSAVGPGTLQIMSFLTTDGPNPCEIKEISVVGQALRTEE